MPYILVFCYIVAGMYIAVDLVLGLVLLIHHSKLKRSGRSTPAMLLAGIAMLIDAVPVMLRPLIYTFQLKSSFFDYLFGVTDLSVTGLFLMAGLALVLGKFPPRRSLLRVSVSALAIMLIYVFTGNIVIFSALTFIWLAVLFVVMLRKVNRYNKVLPYYYSNVGKHRNSWLIYVIVWSFVVYPLYKFACVSIGHADLFYILYDLSSMAMYLIVTYNLIAQTADSDVDMTVVCEQVGDDVELAENHEEERQNVNDFFTIEQQRMMMEQLAKMMSEDKVYRDPELCVGDLVKRMGTNATYFYYFMRDVVKSNFFDYVNSFRINEAKALLLKGEKVEFIVSQVGYNSDNTFRRAFKKATGLTPSEWRQSQM